MRLIDARIQQIITNCLRQLELIGFKIDKDLKISLDLFDSTGTFGQCSLGVTFWGEFQQELNFNKHLMRESLEDAIISTVYHELCHYLQNKEAIETGFYYIDDNGNPQKRNDPKLLHYFEDNEGHSECWLKYANRVNNELHPKIPVLAHPEEDDFKKYLDANEEDILFILSCDSCDNKTKFLSYTPHDWESLPLGFLTAIIKHQQEGIKNKFCKCGGSIKIEAKDEKILYNILREETKRFFATMFQGE